MSYESPYEIQERLVAERANKDLDRTEQAAREQQASQGPSIYTPPKGPAEMTPAEIEAGRIERIERERAETTAQIEELRKDRARRAYVGATGGEQGFGELYSSTLRPKMIEEETLAAVQSDDVPIGTETAEGVRW
jgi:hypothetical protein